MELVNRNMSTTKYFNCRIDMAMGRHCFTLTASIYSKFNKNTPHSGEKLQSGAWEQG